MLSRRKKTLERRDTAAAAKSAPPPPKAAEDAQAAQPKHMSAKEKHRSAPRPAQSSSEAEWRVALQAFTEAREENDKSVLGLFEDDARKRRYCERLAGFLRDREAEETYAGREKVKKFSDAVLLLGLEAARMLLCDRGKVLEPLVSAQALQSYATFAARRLRTDIGMEALACLNNALFDSPLAQASFCALPEAKGFGALVAAMEDCEFVPGFARAASVAMFLVVGNQEPESGELSAAFLRACLRGLVLVALKLPRLTHKEFLKRRAHRPPLPAPVPGERNVVAEQGADGVFLDVWRQGDDDASMRRRALTAGFKLLFAVMAAQAGAFMDVLNEALEAKRAATANGTPEESLARVRALRLDTQDMPFLDRAGLLAVRVLAAEAPRLQVTGRAAAADAAFQAEVDALRVIAAKMLGRGCSVDDFSEFVHKRHGSQAFLDLVEELLARIAEADARRRRQSEKTERGESDDDDEDIEFGDLSVLTLPSQTLLFSHTAAVLGASANLVQNSPDARRAFQARVFPGPGAVTPLASGIVGLLGCPDTELKVVAKELLLLLCDDDEQELQRRCAATTK